MKQRIRLTESQLYNLIRNCVNESLDKVIRINESLDYPASSRLSHIIRECINEEMEDGEKPKRNRMRSNATPVGNRPKKKLDPEDPFYQRYLERQKLAKEKAMERDREECERELRLAKIEQSRRRCDNIIAKAKAEQEKIDAYREQSLARHREANNRRAGQDHMLRSTLEVLKWLGKFKGLEKSDEGQED